MERKKITVVGAGQVGATIAHIIATKELADIVLIDVIDGIPQGKALDILEGTPISETDVNIIGTNEYSHTANSDIVVITAGLARKPGMSRDDLLAKNVEIVQSVTEQVAKYSPNSFLIVVTNPLDVMCYLAMKVSGFPKNKVMGQAGALDSSRMRFFIAQELGISVEDVSAFVLGGHGDSMVPLIRYTYAGGIPVENLIPKEKLTAIIERTKNAGGEIVSYLKTGSAYYSTAAATVQMINAILKDKKKITPCSVYLDGEYGFNDLFLGVPVVLGKNGIEKIIEIKLTGEESTLLNKSASDVKTNIVKLKI